MAFSFRHYEPVGSALAMEFCVDFGFSPRGVLRDGERMLGLFGVAFRDETTCSGDLSDGLLAPDIDSIGGIR